MISILVPSIRQNNLLKLYESITLSFSGKFEMIVAGPYELPKIFLNMENVWWVNTHRSPNAAQQEALLQSDGDWICAAADDGEFLPGALDYAMDAMEMSEERTIVVGKYLEGDTPHPDMAKDDYYRFGYHKSYRLKGVPQDGLIFNCGVISRKFMLELGGWDAQNFQATTCAHADLGIRAYKEGAEMILMDTPLFKCSHMPGNTGDHAPINRAMKKDLKTFKFLYGSQNVRTKIYPENWKLTPEIWKERFK